MKTIGEICAEVQDKSGITYDDRAWGFAEEVAARLLAESILDRAKPDSGESAIIPEVKRSNDESERRRL